jgi:16S rRNA (cytosine1402-N4)-methyltransferase
MLKTKHVPVLLREVCEFSLPQNPKIIVDGTVGQGSHILALAKQVNKKDLVCVINDLDKVMLNFSTELLKKENIQVRNYLGNFCDLPKKLNTKISSVLLDLGFNMYHIKESNRGFSFLNDEDLDMRYSIDTQLSAKDLVNLLDQDQLAIIFKNYGDEPKANLFAKKILAFRKTKEIQTTFDLLSALEIIPEKTYKKHPATQIFQALRIAVNDELTILEQTCEKFYEILEEEGRISVITFHSGEDRIIKTIFKQFEKEGKGENLFKRGIAPSREECKSNPPSRSARLRIFIKREKK